jgi:hypothetical protein
LVSNRDQEAEICLQDAIGVNKSASDIRFLLAHMVYYGANRESLKSRFCDHLADDGDAPDYVRRKIDLLLHPFDISSSTVSVMINYLYLPIPSLIYPC